MELTSVFPSGRAAIAQTLEDAALEPSSPVGILGARSGCLTRTVRRLALPIEAAEWRPAEVAALCAVIVYEPWGWPVVPRLWQRLARDFRGQLVLVDRVESADFFLRRESATIRGCRSVEVLSLSKVLGLAGGGLARGEDGYLPFRPQGDSALIQALQRRPVDELANGAYAEFFKARRQATHPAVIGWLETRCVSSAVEDERARRQAHLSLLLESGLADDWTPWMRAAIEHGAGPAAAPILAEADPELRWHAARVLLTEHGVESTQTLFNWSGDPLQPSYGACLALPVHGRIEAFAAIVATLSSLARHWSGSGGEGRLVGAQKAANVGERLFDLRR